MSDPKAVFIIVQKGVKVKIERPGATKNLQAPGEDGIL